VMAVLIAIKIGKRIPKKKLLKKVAFLLDA